MRELQTTEIKQIELEINFYKEQTARNIIEIGNRLIKAKEIVPYGEWGEWLREKVEFSERRAQQFMLVAREFGETKTYSYLTLDKMLALTSLEKEERETFIEENPVEDMTTRELRQVIKEKKELEKQVEELKNKKPEVIETIIEKSIPVTPSDYEELKDRARNSIDKGDFNRLKKEFEEKIDENHELKKQLKAIEITSTEEQHQRKIKDSAIVFSNRVHSFINDVGGLGWLIDYLDELPMYEKQEYIKALELLDRWVTTIKSNINREEF